MISPLLANVYLHYVFDLWVEAWREKVAQGDLMVVRYADDLGVGFQHREEAERFLREFQERLAKFGLEIHPDKTRLIEFGRYAQANRRKRGEGKPWSELSGPFCDLAADSGCARVLHPYPSVRFDATHPRQEPYAVIPLVRICAGAVSNDRPYFDVASD